MKIITLTQGKFAKVDDEDYEYLNQWKWHYGARCYAVRSGEAPKVNGKRQRKRFFMHRVVNKTPDGFETDHIDLNTLNNQKYNLRDATTSKNGMNVRSRKNSTSKFKGVFWDRRKRKWICRLVCQKVIKYEANFDCEVRAAKAYDEAALKHHGKFARINFQSPEQIPDTQLAVA